MTLLSGVGEGALASHYTAEWTKDGYIPYTNISRGSDFSLNINSVDISDNGTYTSEVIITPGSGGTHLVPSGRPINLIVYGQYREALLLLLLCYLLISQRALSLSEVQSQQ